MTTDTETLLSIADTVASLHAVGAEHRRGHCVAAADQIRASATAITAHVEAEVARRLAAAPDVEAAIAKYGVQAAGGADTTAAETALRAAFAADKARAVEAARISIGTVSDLGDIVACRIAALGEPRWRRYLAKRSEMAVGS